ncbi:MAG TPA: hypothetical protein VGI10_03225 [Polyangiaceae bacterium]|jgi:hypothetical protein
MAFKSWFRSRGSVILLSILTLFLLLTSSACTVTSSDSGPVGVISVGWTLESSSDPNQCSAHGASTISIQLFDNTGAQFGAASTAACSGLSTMITNVPVGAYTVKAELLDSIGNLLTSVVTTANPVIVNEGQTSGVVIDFPAGSFVQPGITTGTLGVSWTIASATDPTQCANNGASSIELQLTDTAGTPIGAATTAACTAFATTIDGIVPGTYALTVTMLDVNGAAVTTPFSIPNLTITAGATTSQPVDFPLNSFIGGTTTTGSLEVDWTIGSGTNAADCDAHGAANISLQLYDQSGTPIGARTLDPCSSFSATIPGLEPGSYQVSAELVDLNQTPVTTEVPPQNLTITVNTVTQQGFDFPSSSFLQ